MTKEPNDKPSPEPAPDAEIPAADAPAEADPKAAPANAETDALRDRLLRLQADFDNFRKRTQRERAELFLKANEDMLRDLLPVLDAFEKGLATAAQSSDKAVHDGFQMVYDQLVAMTRKYGLTAIDAHESAFDPHHHEAVTHAPSTEYAEDQIIAQLRRGYKLGDRLIRAVQVVVSSGPGAPRDDEVASDPPPAQDGKA